MLKYALVLSTLLLVAPATAMTVNVAGIAEKGKITQSDTTPYLQLTKAGRRYFAISGCFRRWSSARKRAKKIGGHVINTSNYANLNSGYRCAVRGLNWRWFAKSNCRKIRRKGYDCYVKAAY